MPFKIIAIVAVACAILGFIAFKLMNKNKTKTFDPTMEVEKKRQSAEETLLESR
ncbi:MAG: hypothetical protein HYS98_05075, partial [Deltaproteobacteria bacterium]|nr:hypothetical protein [Deltaproteobacteria bacterium]